jgi:lipid A 3-O-deacylase
LGTLNTKINTGLNVLVGWFNDRYQTAGGNKRKFELYIFSQGRINVIGYDASLQGGVFNHRSVHTIAAADLSRLVFQADGGIIMNYKTIYLSYTQSFLTEEFMTGKTHRWGGTSFGIRL